MTVRIESTPALQRPPVAVLMSTYNGAAYVGEQIQSILAQFQAHDRLYIRDDGSRDDTLKIIEDLDDSRIVLERGENLGFAKSFFHLMYHAPADYAMYMLADQDDVWLPHKIDRAYEFIGKNQGPFLYCSRLKLVDVQLQPLGMSPAFPKPPSFENAVAENIVTGCTAAFNPAGMALLRSVPFEALMQQPVAYHDWWLYLNFSRFGAVFFDGRAEILYRQHGGNSIGMADGWRRYLNMLAFVRKKSWLALQINQARAFLKTRGAALTPAEARWLSGICQDKPAAVAWRLFFDRKIVRQMPLGRVLFSALVLHDYLMGRIRP